MNNSLPQPRKLRPIEYIGEVYIQIFLSKRFSTRNVKSSEFICKRSKATLEQLMQTKYGSQNLSEAHSVVKKKMQMKNWWYLEWFEDDSF